MACCGNGTAMCGRDPQCADRQCEGHPCNSGYCSTCYPGPCKTPLVCMVPIAEIRPIQRRLFTRPRLSVSPKGFVVGALFAASGLAFFIVEAIRYVLNNQH